LGSHFLGHPRSDHFGLIYDEFSSVREPGVAYGKQPKERRDPHEYDHEDAQARHAVEGRIEEEAAPFLPRQEICGRN
jgi:hypothetical protein